MTAFIVAIAILALLLAGRNLGFVAAKHTRTTSPSDYAWQAAEWLAVAGGAVYVLVA